MLEIRANRPLNTSRLIKYIMNIELKKINFVRHIVIKEEEEKNRYAHVCERMCLCML